MFIISFIGPTVVAGCNIPENSFVKHVHNISKSYNSNQLVWHYNTPLS